MGARDLPDKNWPRKSNDYIIAVALIVLLLTSFDVYSSPNFGNVTFLIIAVVVPTIYLTKVIRYPYFEREFKINRNKIDRIEIEKDTVTFEFRNSEDDRLFHSFKEMEAKGLDFFQALIAAQNKL